MGKPAVGAAPDKHQKACLMVVKARLTRCSASQFANWREAVMSSGANAGSAPLAAAAVPAPLFAIMATIA